MDARVTELQQVILKKDLMILQLQTRLDAYVKQYGELDEPTLAALQAQEHDDASEVDRRRGSSNNSFIGSGGGSSHVNQSHISQSQWVDGLASAPGSSAATPQNANVSPVPVAPATPNDPGIEVTQDTNSAAAAALAASLVAPASAQVVSCLTGKNIALDYVQDSPMFRRQVEGFEESLTGLRGLLKEILARTKDYTAAGMRYGEEETSLADEIAHRKYARALFTTSCPELGSLSSLFNEFHDTIKQVQSSRVSMLLSVEALLHHSIYKFAEQELKEAGDLRKEVSRLADEYESQLGKLLGKNRQNNSSSSMGAGNGSQSAMALTPADSSNILGSANGSFVASPAVNMNMPSSSSNGAKSLEREVMQARLRFELARFDLVRYLNRLDCQKKFLLVECFNSTLYAFLSHYHACQELIKSIEPALRQRQEMLQKSRQDFEEDDKMWASQRDLLETHLKANVENDLQAALRSFDLPVEVISCDTHASRSTYMGSIVKQGYLFLRNSMFPARSWKRRWFQIHSGKLYQNRGKHMDLTMVCDLMLSRVRECASSSLPYCFEIIDSSQSKFLLQATSEADMNDWVEAARKSTESMLEKQSHRQIVHPEQQKVIQELLAKNTCCADCGQTPAEWVSINIGCFLCIECSGIHRSLGVHVSKVRSLTLDSWEMSLLVLLRDHLGNQVVNSIWEHTIPSAWAKPCATSTREEKTNFIKAKYHFHGFAEFSELQPDEITAKFIHGSSTDDVHKLMWCLAHGVDVNARSKQELETALHVAASFGSASCCDYLILNGASLVLADVNGKLPYDAAKTGGFEAVKLVLMQKMSLEQYQF